MTDWELGLHPGIPADVYHRMPGVSQSMLKILRDSSPAHLQWRMEHPQPPTAAQTLGAAIHDCVLIPDEFERLWVRGIEGDGRTKAVKEARRELEELNPTATVLKPEDFDTCLWVRDAIARHPKARQLLMGDAEQSAFWLDPKTGILCRGRFDLLGHKTGTIVDLKTTISAARAPFSRSIFSYGYHIQAAHYLAGARALDLPHTHFAIIAVEKTPPYGIALYELADPAIEDGARELEPLMETYAWCLENNTWPGYSEDVEVIDLPRWAAGQIDERLEEMDYDRVA